MGCCNAAGGAEEESASAFAPIAAPRCGAIKFVAPGCLLKMARKWIRSVIRSKRGACAQFNQLLFDRCGRLRARLPAGVHRLKNQRCSA